MCKNLYLLFFPHADLTLSIFTFSFVRQLFHRNLLWGSTNLLKVYLLFLKFIFKLDFFISLKVFAFVFTPVVRCGASLFTYFSISQSTCWYNQTLTINQNMPSRINVYHYARNCRRESAAAILSYLFYMYIYFPLSKENVPFAYTIICFQGKASFWLQKNKQMIAD